VSFRQTDLGGGDGRSRSSDLGGGGEIRRSSEFLEGGLPCYIRNVAAGDTKIAELAVGEAAQLVHGLAVAAPVAVAVDQVHRLAHLSRRSCISCVTCR